jgi:hypothetical protein
MLLQRWPSSQVTCHQGARPHKKRVRAQQERESPCRGRGDRCVLIMPAPAAAVSQPPSLSSSHLPPGPQEQRGCCPHALPILCKFPSAFAACACIHTTGRFPARATRHKLPKNSSARARVCRLNSPGTPYGNLTSRRVFREADEELSRPSKETKKKAPRV